MVVEVIVDISAGQVDRVFDYLAEGDVRLGQRVAVPFGPKTIEGFIIGIKDNSDVQSSKLKYISGVLDDFVAITPEMLELVRFMTKKYHLRTVDVLRLCIPSKLRGGKVRDILLPFATLAVEYEQAQAQVGVRAPKQQECLAHLKRQGDFVSELNKLFGAAAVNALKEKGLLALSEVHFRRVPPATERADTDIVLSDAQKAAVDAVTGGSGTYLLHGVTGSGKTEVYMHAIDAALKKGKTAIMLVPEISLTPQMLGVFRARFGDMVAVQHSGLSDGEKFDEWKRLLFGEAKIALGARSAIFAPLTNVGVVIIDEEHDGSYISDANPRYDTKEVAEFRARQSGAPLILGSATPQIESRYKADTGEYTLLTLPNRICNKSLPDVEIVDMSREIRMGNNEIFSAALKSAMTTALERGEQSIIFLNRRGYFSYVMCRDCGYIAKCSNCDVSLTYHKTENRLKCHCCGATYTAITRCPICGGQNLRQGHIGTENVVEAVNRLLPAARVIRMDNDTTRTKGAHQSILDTFARGDADVMVGTQMIAKGHDFKNVTVVGILEADYSLYLSDYRSNERTFQLVTQVAGRAGRQSKGGKVYLQTYTPRHYVFRFAAAYDYEGFYAKELNSRQVTRFPPFALIVRVLVTSEEDVAARKTSRGVYDELEKLRKANPDAFIYFQGMRSPIERLQNSYRYQILMRLATQGVDELMDGIYAAVDKNKNNKTSVFVEINPQNLN